MHSEFLLWTIVTFSVLQAVTSQSTVSVVTGTKPVSEIWTFECSPEDFSCTNPNQLDPGNGSFQLKYFSNCEPYLKLACDQGYTGTVDTAYCINNNWEPSVTDGSKLCAKNCGKPPDIAFSNVFLLLENSDTIDEANYSTAAEYEHETEIIYQCLYYTTSGSNSNLQRSRCLDGKWEPPPSLECTANPNSCQGEIIGLAILGVFFGIESILLIIVLIFYCRRCCSDKDDISMAVPNKRHSGNTFRFSDQGLPTFKTSMEDTPVYPPPRPPARTDTAVVGKDESSYYTYADVPVENGKDNNALDVNGDEISDHGVQENKSIPHYLEIIS